MMVKKTKRYRPRNSGLMFIGVWISLSSLFGCFPPPGPGENDAAESSKLIFGSRNLQQIADITDLASTQMTVHTFYEKGKWIERITVSGRPPTVYREPAVENLPQSDATSGIVILSNVPAFTWSYGCSATAAGMMMGYYDTAEYANMYAGPFNGGVCPMNNDTAWPGVTSGECPFVASHLGIDGRTTRGHVDDYWISLGDPGPDPYVSGGWPAHTPADCTADFMGTNQAQYDCEDGKTEFYSYKNGAPLYDYISSDPSFRDGCHGMRLFVESRGYAVAANFIQYILGYNGNTNGFSFTNFMTEIDAGRPVMIQVTNHSMVGFGYDAASQMIYVHDTWDHSNHLMPWGGTYAGLQHYAVVVLRLAVPFPAPTVTGITPNFDPNKGLATIRNLSGTEFRAGATVKLIRDGQADIAATNVVRVSSTKLTCKIDLTGAATGTWDVVVTNPDAQAGVLPNGFTILAASPYTPGDANADGKVDVSDLGVLAANYGLTGGATWQQGDFNYDGAVGVSDLGIMGANYGTGTGRVLDFNQDVKKTMK